MELADSKGVRAAARRHSLCRAKPAPRAHTKMELSEPFIEDEAEPFRETEVFREVDSGFNPSADPFEPAANLVNPQVSSGNHWLVKINRGFVL